MRLIDMPDAFVQTVLNQIALLLLRGAFGDMKTAMHAATVTLRAMDAQTDAECRLAARVICFNLQSIEALAQATRTDLPLNLVLRLRSGAVSLAREAEKAEKHLARLKQDRRPARQPNNFQALLSQFTDPSVFESVMNAAAMADPSMANKAMAAAPTAEPSMADTAPAEATPAEATPAESKPGESKPSEPAPAAPAHAAPALARPAPAEPRLAAPAHAAPGSVEARLVEEVSSVMRETRRIVDYARARGLTFTEALEQQPGDSRIAERRQRQPAQGGLIPSQL